MHKLSLWLLILVLSSGCNRSEEPEAKNTLKIAVENDPQTLDPRLPRVLSDTTVMHMLYEGLMRVNNQGIPEKALAEQIVISDDLKKYEIHLKDSMWSDGSPLTSSDFVEAWKSMLDPNFPSPNASQLYVIKGGKDAKLGQLPLAGIGLTVVSDHVFIIELEQPTVYFPELLSTHFFFPLPKSVRQRKQPNNNPQGYLYNGPFVLSEWKPHNELSFQKNENYWDKSQVKLENVVFVVSDELTALTLFERGDLDWVGSPLSSLPQDSLPHLKEKGALRTCDACGTYWFRFNVEAPPFNDVNARKAFTLALNRKALVEHVTQGNQKPALGLLPPSLSTNKDGFYQDNQLASAKEFFQKAIKNGGFPTVTICYNANELSNKIAQTIQQQWQTAFNISISLLPCETKVSFDKQAKGNYQIMLGSWFADINDPINYFNVFKFKNNGGGGEDSQYNHLLDLSDAERNPVKRRELFLKAESILMSTLPIAPLYYNAFNYTKKDSVEGVYFSSLGFLDFKNARINTSPKEEIE